MELAGELRRALDGVCAAGAPEVRENGEWLAGLEGAQYEVSGQNGTALLHLWSGQQSLVRRVLRVAEESAGRVVLEVSRFGYPRPAHLEFVAGTAPRDTRRVGREQFSLRLRRLLTDHFPDETVESLATAADLHRSPSGSYTRGITRRGSEAYAVLAASPEEGTRYHRRDPDLRPDLAATRPGSRPEVLRPRAAAVPAAADVRSNGSPHGCAGRAPGSRAL
jgi:hypothetical protein